MAYRDHAQLRQQRLNAGLCADCGKVPYRPGRHNCESCGKRAAAYQKQVRAARTKAGLCYRCGKNPPKERPESRGRPAKNLMCDECTNKARIRQRERRAANDTLYERRKAAGLCASCGKERDSEQYVNCSDCRRRHRLVNARARYSTNGLKALERDKCCQLCGMEKHLHVHHKDGNGADSDQPNDSLDNLIALCRRCHYGVTLLTTRGVNRGMAIELIEAVS